MLNKLMIQGGIYAYQYIQKIIQMIQAYVDFPPFSSKIL